MIESDEMKSTESIVIKRMVGNDYSVKYSEFDGYVFITVNPDGSILKATFSGNSKTPVSAEDMRKFPLNAVQILISNRPESAPANTRPKLVPVRSRPLKEEFMKSLAEYYLDALSRNERPLCSIEEATGACRNTVARWVSKARKDGYLK